MVDQTIRRMFQQGKLKAAEKIVSLVDPHLFDKLPSNLVFGPIRVLSNNLLDTLSPVRHFFF